MLTHFEPHTCVPAGHWHAPPAQAMPGGQATPQPPQFCGSTWVSTQAFWHKMPEAHLHTPPTQVVGGWQVAPQDPQFCGST